LPFFSTIDTGAGRLADVLPLGLGPGAAEEVFGRSGVLDVAVRDRMREKMLPRLLGFGKEVPVLPRSDDLDGALGRTPGLMLGLLPEGSGRFESLGAFGLTGRVVRMPRLEFEAGRRMPEELLGLGAEGRLMRPEAPRDGIRIEGAFEVRAVAAGRPEERDEVADFGAREGARDVPLRLERLGTRVFGRDVLREVLAREEEREVGREVEREDEERPRTAEAAPERLEGRADREVAGGFDDLLEEEGRFEELDGRSFASVIVVPSSKVRQARYAMKPPGFMGRKFGRLGEVGFWCVMIASFRS
jgi:hypothetical protein